MTGLMRMPAYKLHSRIDFQGLPISIENGKGSSRHWTDEATGETGSTKMEYPYGYVRGTLGTDGDAVDVFIGPNKKSRKIFVITQMKKPEFKEVDEQKCMLGFNSAKDAKDAYLRHYDDPKFFGSMVILDIEEFADKLQGQKGKLIKSLLKKYLSAKLREDYSHGDSYMNSLDMLKGISSAMRSAKDSLEKALTSRSAVVTARKIEDNTPSTDNVFGTGAPLRDGERTPYVMRKAEVDYGTYRTHEGAESCAVCKTQFKKSMDGCPRCKHTNSIAEATPLWKR